MTDSLLSCTNLTIRVGDRLIINEQQFTFKAGQVWGILGSNGVGKSTLLHTLAGLRHQESGQIELCGKPLQEIGRKKIAQQLGILFQQQPESFPATVLETTLIGRHPFIDTWKIETASDRLLAKQALAQVDLGHLEQRFVNTLSGGERQRMKIATLLTQNPKVMLLDEPANHLDLHHQIKLLELLCQQNAKQQGCLVMVLHDLNLANRFCDHILLMFAQGHPLSGQTVDVMRPENLERTYGWPIGVTETADGRFFYTR